MMECYVVTLIITVLAAILQHADTSSVMKSGGELNHHAVLDQHGSVVMLWTSTDDTITVEVQAATKGWVGLGFSPNGGMRGADIMLGWLDDSSGELHVHDRYAHGMTTPVVDHSQDVVVEGGYQNNTHTVIRFSRPWNTCDSKHDFKLSSDTMRVIWAYGENDPVDEMTMERHVERGTKSIYLKEPRFTSPQPSPHIKTWDIRAPNVSLPSHTDTLYWCKIYEVPKFTKKVHVIGFTTLISKENTPFVHHILVYACTASPAYLNMWSQYDGVQCRNPNMPPSWSSCRTILIAWAVGSEGEMWPDHAGIPLGDHDSPTHVMVEMHYDNPNMMRGVVDNSGVRIYYTDDVRQYDAGVLMVGHSVTENMIIPPGQRWNTVGHCHSSCTQWSFPEGGVKVFQVFLHAHLAGRGLTVKHIRNHRELPLIAKDLNYDFNYQQGRLLEEEVTIQPGDSLIVECDYDATQRLLPTFGGESTSEEMCLAFLIYYPKVPMILCTSDTLVEDIYQPLGVQNINKHEYRDKWGTFNEEREKELAEALLESNKEPAVGEIKSGDFFKNVSVVDPVALRDRTLYDVLHDEATWRNQKNVKELQKRVAYGPKMMQCLKNGKYKSSVEKYPHYITVNTLDDDYQCSGSHHSQQYFTVQPEVNKEGGGESLALRVSFTLTSLVLAPLVLLLVK